MGVEFRCNPNGEYTHRCGPRALAIDNFIKLIVADGKWDGTWFLKCDNAHAYPRLDKFPRQYTPFTAMLQVQAPPYGGLRLLLRPGQHNLAAIALQHGVEALLEIMARVAVRDDRADVQARLEHDGHLVPGFVHLPAINALEIEHVEDDDVPVDGEFLVGDAEHGDLAAVAHVGEHVAERRRVAGHFQADVEAFAHAELLLHVGQRRRSRIDGQVGAQLAGQFEAIGIEVGDDDVAGPGMFDDGRGHAADRAGAGDEHVLAEHVERQGGVHRVAERIEDRLHIAGNAADRAPRRWSSAATDIRQRRRAD